MTYTFSLRARSLTISGSMSQGELTRDLCTCILLASVVGFPHLLTLFACAVRFVCLFGVLRRFQHCTGHITTGSWKGRGNQYIQFARVLYCKLPTNGSMCCKIHPRVPCMYINPLAASCSLFDIKVVTLLLREFTLYASLLSYP